GVYEDERWEKGTRELLRAASGSSAYSVIGGGDTITAAARHTGLDGYSYVCTAGGAMIQFLSGKKLPLLEAMKA
ncbi:MAG: phosphoglycerate kinase, partial [Spirochaetales bacterium]|nr:phosphoglycerate kinase [Spirochaetales bacterium]